MKRTIKKLINKLGYDLNPLPLPLIQNYFHKNNNKVALISYITHPFKAPISYTHTNGFECFEIARVLDELGFNVDIIDWHNTRYRIAYDKYNLIFGLGAPIENSFYAPNCLAKRIYYGTGCHPYFQNEESLKRVKTFFEEHKVWLTASARIVDSINSKCLVLSDAIFILGNEFVAETYKKTFTGPIKKINASSILTYPSSPNDKQFDESHRHFLWFGSIGLLHKGLDLVLDTFSNRSDIYLHVCAPLSKEPVFEQFFYKQLYETANIKTYGFIDIRSETFKKLLDLCAFGIFPSASEGGCPSLLNLMRNSGIIPLVTTHSGLDVKPFGFIIDELSTVAINNTISEVLQLNNIELLTKTQQSLEYAEKHHTLDCFRAQMKAHFLEILELK